MHRGPQAAGSGSYSGSGGFHAPNAALLIDFDNVTTGVRSDLGNELRNLLSSDIIKGKVAVQRAYADWRRYPQHMVPLAEASIDTIQATAYGSAKKNATDIRLAVDAIELVFTRPEIGTYILLSGDSDFSSLVLKLKEYGKYVIGVGIRESSSDLLVMNCDEYYSYNALAGLVKSGDEAATKYDPWELVTEAVTRMKRNGDVMRSDRLKQVMQEIDPDFDEKELGHPKFSRFCQKAAERGLLSVTKLENGQLEIDLPRAGGAVQEAPRRESHPPREASPAAAQDDTASATAEDRARRGRRGRGRGRGGAPGRERVEHAGRSDTPVPVEFVETASTPPSAEPAEFEIMEPPAEAAPQARGRGRDGRGPRGPSRGPESAPPPRAEIPPEAPPRADEIGTGGVRLTKDEAFDLVRRSVASLTRDAEDSARASDVRVRARELLGRDSETLAEHYFGRILRDAHDADVIDLRRRGNDFEVARAAEAAPVAEQLSRAAAASASAQAPPAGAPAPRGMGPRGGGSAGRGRGSFGGRAGTPPPLDLLSIGVVDVLGAAVPPSVPESPPPRAAQVELDMEPTFPVAEEDGAAEPAAKRTARPRAGATRGRAAKKVATARAAESTAAPKVRRSRPRKTVTKDGDE